MPRFDRTGPLGQGPRTGQGMGSCDRGYAFRRCWGVRGFGWGFGPGYFAPQWFGERIWSKQDEKQALVDYRKSLEEELEEVKKEEEELDKSS